MVMKEENTVMKKEMMKIRTCLRSTMVSDIKFLNIKYFNYSNY